MENGMELALAALVGLALSAACGFRVFVPPLVISIAAQAGSLELAEGFDWIATPAATIAFAVATALEVGGYFVPWLDNALDVLSVPAAGVAGTVLTASMVTDVSPFLQWSLAVVAGGGSATTVSAGMALLRGKSTVLTLGLANPVVSLLEAVAAGTVSVLAAFAPLLAALLAVSLALGVVVLLRRRADRRDAAEDGASIKGGPFKGKMGMV